MLKKIFAVLSIGVITIAGLSMFSPVTKVEAAECSLAIVLIQQPSGIIHTSDKTVKFNSSTDSLSLRYVTKDCVDWQSSRPYKLIYSPEVPGNASGGWTLPGNLSKDLDGRIDIPKPVNNQIDTFEFILYKSNGINPESFPAQKLTIKYEVTSSPDTTTGSNYKPTNVAICKLADDTSRINWLTKDATNSALEYSVQGSTPTASQKIVKSTALTNHYLTLTALTKGKTYGFVIYIPKAGEKTASVASHDSDTYRTFVAGETNDSTCTKDGTIDPPNNSTPNAQINTGITADLGDLDQVLGSIFNPLTVWSVPELITSIIRVLFALISIAAIVIIIISGFRMVLASGNEEQLTKAKKAITWAIIGLIVSLLSFSIVSIIQNLISR